LSILLSKVDCFRMTSLFGLSICIHLEMMFLYYMLLVILKTTLTPIFYHWTLDVLKLIYVFNNSIIMRIICHIIIILLSHFDMVMHHIPISWIIYFHCISFIFSKRSLFWLSFRSIRHTLSTSNYWFSLLYAMVYRTSISTLTLRVFKLYWWKLFL